MDKPKLFDQVLQLVSIQNPSDGDKNRIILSAFCFLIFILLIYFYFISREKIKANNKSGSGLVYLSFSFLLYSILGIVSVYTQNTAMLALQIISGLISFSLLSALSFFSIGTHQIDQWVNSPAWKNGLKYTAFAWVIFTVLISSEAIKTNVDIFLSVLAIAAIGFFVTRYFIRRGLRFIALISGGYFLTYLVLLIFQPAELSGGKFSEMNSLVLSPAMLLAVISLAYTFNWINELSFYELSNIWIDSEQTDSRSYATVSTRPDREAWIEKMAKDKIEEVIQEIIILKKHRNENIEDILNLASRNTRNNSRQLKDIITYEEYQLNRNKIAQGLMSLVRRG